MSAIEPLTKLAGPGVTGFMDRLEAMLLDATGWLGGPAGDAAEGTIAAGGKRLRPLLVYLSAPPEGRDGADLVRAAAAVELIHSATLVHDDIVDRSALRRGRPTVWARAGDGVAAATGDYLFARGFAVLAETGDMAALAALAGCCLGLAEGEAMQMAQARRPQTTAAEYLERCALKTGRLFAVACTLGGRLGGLDELGVDALATFGRCLGLAFQIADDVLDCDGDPRSTGKPLGTDLLDGTPTLPLLAAARLDPAVAAALAVRPAPADVLQLLERVRATGANAEARECALDFARRAEAALDDLGDALDTRALRAVARGVVNRDS